MSQNVDKFYGNSTNKNYTAKGTIGVPHPYMVGSGHIVHASDNFNGMLGESAIVSAEKEGITCQVKNCDLSFGDHNNAVLVHCFKDPEKLESDKLELTAFLKTLCPIIKEDDCVGFTLVDNFSSKLNKGGNKDEFTGS